MNVDIELDPEFFDSELFDPESFSNELNILPPFLSLSLFKNIEA